MTGMSAAALVEYLKAQTWAQAIAGTSPIAGYGAAIYRNELPPAATSTNAPKGIVLVPAGGIAAPETSNVRQPRYDFKFYSISLADAEQMVTDFIKHIESPLAFTGTNGARIFAIVADGEPFVTRETGSLWPFAFFTGTVTARN